MDNTICYLNTDLDLTSTSELTALGNAFEAGGASPLHVTLGDDGRWYATIETDSQYEEPEPNISTLLAIVESLPSSLRLVWDACTRREFNVGYDCGAEPWSFSQALSAALLGRMAALGASLRITLYPDRELGATKQPQHSSDNE